jgi:hypothetical protein
MNLSFTPRKFALPMRSPAGSLHCRFAQSGAHTEENGCIQKTDLAGQQGKELPE